MGRCCSKQITPWHGSSETSGTMSNSSKKIIQEMWIAMKPDSTNFGIAVLIRQVHRKLFCTNFSFWFTVYTCYEPSWYDLRVIHSHVFKALVFLVENIGESHWPEKLDCWKIKLINLFQTFWRGTWYARFIWKLQRSNRSRRITSNFKRTGSRCTCDERVRKFYWVTWWHEPS